MQHDVHEAAARLLADGGAALLRGDVPQNRLHAADGLYGRQIHANDERADLGEREGGAADRRWTWGQLRGRGVTEDQSPQMAVCRWCLQLNLCPKPPRPLLLTGMFFTATWHHPPGAAHRSSSARAPARKLCCRLSWISLKAARER